MFNDLFSTFYQSQQGQNAWNVLQQRGYSPAQAQQIFGSALPAAAEALTRAGQSSQEPALGVFDLFGGHSGAEFLTGAIGGLLRGDGFVGSLEDGAMGMVGGHIAEVLAQRLGMNQRLAGEVAALVTPFIVHYAYERLSSHPAVVQQYGQSPYYR
jgi:hypothetical protein